MRPEIRTKILTFSAGRDRVVDTVKAVALALVVLGHSLAWTILPDGSTVNTLEAAPNLFPLTWVLQILPLFFLMAGLGLVRFAGTPSTPGILKRVDRLISPTLPLLILTMILAVIIGLVAGPDIAEPAGILPVQLTWFIGVYLLVVAASPLLGRLTRPWMFVTYLVVIFAVDMVRANWLPMVGWLNMFLVWALFAAIGMHLPRLRKLPTWQVAVGTVLSGVLAINAVVVGPYSAALITTEALPGLSNLAPPTIVLAFAGLTQIGVLLLVWRVVEGWLANDQVWIPVAVFSSRAMGIYLWHMLFFSMLIAGVLMSGFAPEPLGIGWWGVHIAVLAIVVTIVWFASPGLLRLGEWFAGLLARLVTSGTARGALTLHYGVLATITIIAGLMFLMIGESGVGNPLEVRAVIGLPWIPMIGVVFLAALVGVARRTQSTPVETSRS